MIRRFELVYFEYFFLLTGISLEPVERHKVTGFGFRRKLLINLLAFFPQWKLFYKHYLRFLLTERIPVQCTEDPDDLIPV